ncbi:MAG: 3'-5' exonuclease [Bacteroidetes bacterium]|nr:3'-5' exonuclease [Bacteroidota bacterium]
MELELKRPIAFFDLETTGLNAAKDRIVEISIYKVHPNGTEESKTWLLNPDYPISEEASSIHGFTQDDVKDCPTFKQEAKNISDYLNNCDLAGFNSIRFDIPMLVEEFLRAEVDFDVRTRKMIDVQNIFMKMEPRTLEAASRYYLGKELDGAHSAEADAKATYEVLKAQLDKYKDVVYKDNQGAESTPVINDMNALHAFSSHHRNADLMGQIILNDEGLEVINFGKHKGKTVEEVFTKEPSYYNWMMNADFPIFTKKLITTIKLRMGLNQKK